MFDGVQTSEGNSLERTFSFLQRHGLGSTICYFSSVYENRLDNKLDNKKREKSDVLQPLYIMSITSINGKAAIG